MGAKKNVFDAQGQVQLGKHVDAGNDNVIVCWTQLLRPDQ
jgi:hypothetical protein